MATTNMQRNRPRDGSAEVLRGTLGTLDEERTAAVRRVNEATARRSALLISGTAAEIRNTEEDVRLGQIDVERLSARIEAVESNLSVAVGRVQLASVEALRIEAEQASDAATTWWRDKYPVLANAIKDGLELMQGATGARATYYRAWNVAASDDDVRAAGGIPDHVLSEMPMAFVRITMRAPELFICLPSTEYGGEPYAWPAGYSLVRPQLTGEAAAYSRS